MDKIELRKKSVKFIKRGAAMFFGGTLAIVLVLVGYMLIEEGQSLSLFLDEIVKRIEDVEKDTGNSSLIDRDDRDDFPESVTIGDSESNYYEDSWLSFEYPGEIEIYYSGGGSPRPTRDLTFLYWDEDQNVFRSIGLSLFYPNSFTDEDFHSFKEDYIQSFEDTYGEDSSFASNDEWKEVWYYQDLTVDGRDALITSEGGHGPGKYATLYIAFDDDSEEYTSSDVYMLSREGSDYDEELYDKVMELFMSTVVFKR